MILHFRMLADFKQGRLSKACLTCFSQISSSLPWYEATCCEKPGDPLHMCKGVGHITSISETSLAPLQFGYIGVRYPRNPTLTSLNNR